MLDVVVLQYTLQQAMHSRLLRIQEPTISGVFSQSSHEHLRLSARHLAPPAHQRMPHSIERSATCCSERRRLMQPHAPTSTRCLSARHLGPPAHQRRAQTIEWFGNDACSKNAPSSASVSLSSTSVCLHTLHVVKTQCTSCGFDSCGRAPINASCDQNCSSAAPLEDEWFQD